MIYPRVEQIEHLRGVSHAYIIHTDNMVTLQHFSSMIVTIDTRVWADKKIIVGKNYKYSKSTSMLRNWFMRNHLGGDMSDTKGFEYYLELGAIGNFTIEKLDR